MHTHAAAGSQLPSRRWQSSAVHMGTSGSVCGAAPGTLTLYVRGRHTGDVGKHRLPHYSRGIRQRLCRLAQVACVARMSCAAQPMHRRLRAPASDCLHARTVQGTLSARVNTVRGCACVRRRTTGARATCLSATAPRSPAPTASSCRGPSSASWRQVGPAYASCIQAADASGGCGAGVDHSPLQLSHAVDAACCLGMCKL